MMKKLVIALCAVSAMAFTACSTVETGTDLNGLRLTNDPTAENLGHINAKITGFYILGMPIVAGSAKEVGKCTALTDTVTTSNVTSLITRQAKKTLSATTLLNLQTERTKVLFLPPFFSYHSIEASANAVR